MNNRLCSILVILALALFTSCAKHEGDSGDRSSALEKIEGEENAVLTAAPNVPPPITRTHATKVIVKLEVVEHVKRLAEGVDYTFWTFGGSVPGSFIRVREGDLVEFHLSNRPDSKMPHNIDLHAVTGPGGGAASSLTAPGHTSTFSFTALNPGLYVYHCAAAPVGMHIANGMYGMILVEPKAGLPKVDKEYYVMQGEVYTAGRYGDAGLQGFDMAKALDERPPYVVFNGAVGALTDDKAIKANVGETVRLFVGNGGPNLISSFHVIGEIFDAVYTHAGTDENQHNVQTTLIPAGGATIVDFKVEVPGKYILVDHSIFRAMNKGALAMLEVGGDANAQIYSGKQRDEVYLPEGGNVQSIGAAAVPESNIDLTMAEKMERGRIEFQNSCAACHQLNGQGVPGAFPPLANSDYIRNNRASIVSIPVKGLSGKIVVNGKEYNGVMPAIGLSNHDAASVLTYVLNSFGNRLGEVKLSEVAKARSATPAPAPAPAH